MAHPLVDVGTGAVIVFGSSSWTAEVVSIDRSGRKRAEIDTTHLASTAKTSMPGDLVDPGMAKLTIHMNPGSWPPVTATEETVTLKFPLSGTETTNAAEAYKGYILEGPNYKLGVDERIDAEITVRFSGAVTYTTAA